MDWVQEIDELHAFFEVYFLGDVDESLDRVEAALAADFTMAGPDGRAATRAETMRALAAGHDHTTSLVITTTDHRLIFEAPNVIVATYVENHKLRDRTNHRLATVIFTPDANAPNGLQWLRVHETWIEPAEA